MMVSLNFVGKGDDFGGLLKNWANECSVCVGQSAFYRWLLWRSTSADGDL